MKSSVSASLGFLGLGQATDKEWVDNELLFFFHTNAQVFTITKEEQVQNCTEKILNNLYIELSQIFNQIYQNPLIKSYLSNLDEIIGSHTERYQKKISDLKSNFGKYCETTYPQSKKRIEQFNANRTHCIDNIRLDRFKLLIQTVELASDHTCNNQEKSLSKSSGIEVFCYPEI